MVKSIPEGFRTVTPYFVVEDADKLLSFLAAAFGAKITLNHKFPNGRVMHAQAKIGDSMIMLSDAPEGKPAVPCVIYLYVPDCDAFYKSALAAGGTSQFPMTDQFYGDRSGAVQDPCGNVWWISTHNKDVSDADLLKASSPAKK